MAGLLPPLKRKIAGVESNFKQVMVKARFEEANGKLKEFTSAKTPPPKVSVTPKTSQKTKVNLLMPLPAPHKQWRIEKF